MFGVPADLPLNRLVGGVLIQIAIGIGDIQFHFSTASPLGKPEGTTVCVTGRWEIRDAEGLLVDGFVPHDERWGYRAHLLLNRDVIEFHIESPHSFSLVFDSGLTLTCFDDARFESIAIYPDEIII